MFVVCASVIAAIFILAFLGGMPPGYWFEHPKMVQPAAKARKPSAPIEQQNVKTVAATTSFLPPHLVELKNAYPELAYGAGGQDLEGTWIVEARVDKNGRLQDLKLSKEGVSDLNILHAAVVTKLQQALRESRFEPAACNGHPMDAWYVNTIPFRRENKNNLPEEPPVRITSNMVQPELINKVEPNLLDSHDKRLNAVSIFESVLTRQGFPRDTRVLRSTGDPEMDCRIIDCITQWRYKPAMLKGRPVPVYFTITVNIDFR